MRVARFSRLPIKSAIDGLIFRGAFINTGKGAESGANQLPRSLAHTLLGGLKTQHFLCNLAFARAYAKLPHGKTGFLKGAAYVRRYLSPEGAAAVAGERR